MLSRYGTIEVGRLDMLDASASSKSLLAQTCSVGRVVCKSCCNQQVRQEVPRSHASTLCSGHKRNRSPRLGWFLRLALGRPLASVIPTAPGHLVCDLLLSRDNRSHASSALRP